MFNKDYRYNYKFDNSPIVTNVLFVDTIKQVGSDTLYALNRIAVPSYSCPYDNNPWNVNKYYHANMPQFLQRTIRKSSSGLVSLLDTTKIVILPNCSQNQSWLFDSIYNNTATCYSVSTQNLFGIIDSVKTILVNNVDTVKLSKSFGLIVFPELYGKNKYYRMSGIEKRNSYDSIPFIGEKVPNAWDFYNFSVGDMFCRVIGSQYLSNSNITVEKTTISAKNAISDGYLYTFNAYTYQVNGPFGASCNWTYTPSFTLSTKTTSFNNLSNPLLFENKIYPKMLYVPASSSGTIMLAEFNSIFTQGLKSLSDPNLVYYGTDNNGRFYKHMGNLCINSANPVMPNPGAPSGLDYISNSYFVKSSSNVSRLCVGENVGLAFLDWFHFESLYTYNLTNLRRNGIDYFGPPNVLGIDDHVLAVNELAYPNPVQNILKIPVNYLTEIELINSVGQTVFSKLTESELLLNTSELPNGIYFLSRKNKELSTKQKLIIQH